MSGLGILLSSLLAAASGGPAEGPAPAPLEPSKAWVVHFDDTECYAERAYGPAADPTIFGMRSSAMGGTYQLFLAHRGSASRFAEQIQLTIDFGKSEIKPYALRYASDDHAQVIDKLRIDAAAIEGIDDDAVVGLRVGAKPPIRLALHDMKALVATLGKCTADLQRYWNMAPAQKDQIASGPIGDVRKLFRSEDYPQEAFVGGQSGKGQFLLFIDEQGKVAACDAVVPSRVPALDGMSCQVIRARAGPFEPARDAAGKAIRGSYVTPPIKWMMGF